MSKEIWYRARFGEITPVEVVSSTIAFVVLASNSHREKKSTDWCSYFQTWDDAKAWLVKSAEHECDKTAALHAHAKAHLEKIKTLQPEQP